MDKFKFIMSGLWDFLQPFIKVLLTRGGLILLSATKQAVLAVEMDMKGVKGTEKKAAAFALIKKDLISAGIDMATDMINGTIDAAVIRMNRQ